jgi:hypothetical protein
LVERPSETTTTGFLGPTSTWPLSSCRRGLGMTTNGYDKDYGGKNEARRNLSVPPGVVFGICMSCVKAIYRLILAPAPPITSRTSSSVSMLVSPRVVWASAPWAAPKFTAPSGPRLLRKP